MKFTLCSSRYMYSTALYFELTHFFKGAYKVVFESYVYGHSMYSSFDDIFINSLIKYGNVTHIAGFAKL